MIAEVEEGMQSQICTRLLTDALGQGRRELSRCIKLSAKADWVGMRRQQGRTHRNCQHAACQRRRLGRGCSLPRGKGSVQGHRKSKFSEGGGRSLHVLRPASTSISVVLPAPDVPMSAHRMPGLQQDCHNADHDTIQYSHCKCLVVDHLL